MDECQPLMCGRVSLELTVKMKHLWVVQVEPMLTPDVYGYRLRCIRI